MHSRSNSPGGYSISLPPEKLAVVVVIAFVVFITFMGLLYYMCKYPGKFKDGRKRTKEFYRNHQKLFEDMFTHGNILIITYQIIIEFSSVHSNSGGVSLPKPFNRIINFFDFLTLDIFNLVPLQCVSEKSNYSTELLVVTLVPIFGFIFCSAYSQTFRRRGFERSLCDVSNEDQDEEIDIRAESDSSIASITIYYKKTTVSKKVNHHPWEDEIETSHEEELKLNVPRASSAEEIIKLFLLELQKCENEIFKDERRLKPNNVPENFDLRFKDIPFHWLFYKPLDWFHHNIDRRVAACQFKCYESDETYIEKFKVCAKGGGQAPLRFYMYLMYLALPTISTVIMSAFRCDKFYYYEAGKRLYKEYLVYDYSVSCNSSLYKAMQIYAGFMIVAYPFGIPIILLIELCRKRKILDPISSIYEDFSQGLLPDEDKALRRTFFADKRPSDHEKKTAIEKDDQNLVALKWQIRMIHPDIKHLRFLFRPYAMSTPFWAFAIVDLYRRLMLTSMLLIFGDPGKQLLYVIVLCLFFVNMYRELQPYNLPQHNVVSYVCQWQILIVAICIMLLETSLVPMDETSVGGVLIALNVSCICLIVSSPIFDRKCRRKEVQWSRKSGFQRSDSGFITEIRGTVFNHAPDGEGDVELESQGNFTNNPVIQAAHPSSVANEPQILRQDLLADTDMPVAPKADGGTESY